jgi:hypothetical protein
VEECNILQEARQGRGHEKIGGGTKRVRVTRGSRNPRHGKEMHYLVRNLENNAQENTRNFHATRNTQHLQAPHAPYEEARGRPFLFACKSKALVAMVFES